MTDEEKAEEYIRTDGTNGEKMWKKIHKEFPNCIVVKTTKSKERLLELLLEYTKAVYLEGLAEGRKEICNLCEEHMLELRPNAIGCAFRCLGNEYCWETIKNDRRRKSK